ncbi:hypothetical protein LDENG_00167320 [Lucifuga dentata]|nr:hypothetical protein LDENG_00167320 [Lucifuga dentata]
MCLSLRTKMSKILLLKVLLVRSIPQFHKSLFFNGNTVRAKDESLFFTILLWLYVFMRFSAEKSRHEKQKSLLAGCSHIACPSSGTTLKRSCNLLPLPLGKILQVGVGFPLATTALFSS